MRGNSTPNDSVRLSISRSLEGNGRLLKKPGPARIRTFVYRSRRAGRLPAWFAPLITATESAAIGARGHRLRFVDGQVSTTVLVPVEFIDGALSAFSIAHLHKRKPTRLASRSIANDVDGAHLTGGREQRLKIGFGRFVRQVAD